MLKNRLCIYPKDVQRITGKSEKYGRNLLQKIRVQNSKAKHQFVTIDEFCTYTGFDRAEIEKYLND